MPDVNPYAVRSYRCAADRCNKTKGENNHWFIALRIGNGTRGLLFQEWNEAALESAAAMPVCGQECAHRLLDKFLQPLPSAPSGSERGAGGE